MVAVVEKEEQKGEKREDKRGGDDTDDESDEFGDGANVSGLEATIVVREAERGDVGWIGGKGGAGDRRVCIRGFVETEFNERVGISVVVGEYSTRPGFEIVLDMNKRLASPRSKGEINRGYDVPGDSAFETGISEECSDECVEKMEMAMNEEGEKGKKMKNRAHEVKLMIERITER